MYEVSLKSIRTGPGHEVDKAYGVLTLIIFNLVAFRSYTLHPTFLPLLETFCELLFRDV